MNFKVFTENGQAWSQRIFKNCDLDDELGVALIVEIFLGKISPQKSRFICIPITGFIIPHSSCL